MAKRFVSMIEYLGSMIEMLHNSQNECTQCSIKYNNKANIVNINKGIFFLYKSDLQETKHE